jgi:6-pyruvoyltetrahydropterin/6-carboxytetrahydropterin synthase
MAGSVFELCVEFVFESAHFMPEFPEGHPNRKMHGHTYYGVVTVENKINPATGYVMDVAEFQKLIRPVVQKLDHNLLNDIKGLEQPSSERIAAWLWQELLPIVDGLKQIEIKRPSVGMSVRYRG